MQTFPEDVDALCELVKSLVRPHVVEIGTWVGATAIAMESAGAASILCVDTFEGSSDANDQTSQSGKSRDEIYALFVDNVGYRLGRTIFADVGKSAEVAEDYLHSEFDLVFIDADHRYEAVKADLAAWVPKVRTGGIVACHDYGLWPGVTRAVDELGVKFTLAGKSLAWWRV